MEEETSIGQFKAEAFLDEFVQKLAEHYGNEIDFILLFGSAARGEFVLGKSDVDLVIQLKRDSAKKVVEKYAERLFWYLDKKHGMKLRQVCSTGLGKNLLENALKVLEKQARLYKPFEVFGPKDIDWDKGMIKRLDLMPGAIFVASQLTLLYKMKNEGKILYGRDIRKEINPRFTKWEKLKAIWVPQSIALSSVLIALLLPKKAVQYAAKALFYEVESVNIFLQNKIPEGDGKMQGFANATEFKNRLLNDLRVYLELKFELLGEQRLAFVQEAAKVKKEGFKGGRIAAFKFCRKAFSIIYSVNTAIILKTHFDKSEGKKKVEKPREEVKKAS